LEGLDFWLGAIVEELSQPIEGRESSETWDAVVRREERGQREGTGGKVNQITRGRAPFGGRCWVCVEWERGYALLTGEV